MNRQIGLAVVLRRSTRNRQRNLRMGKMKKKNSWRPLSILAEHDLHLERLSREWKESQSAFRFLDGIKVSGITFTKFLIRKAAGSLRKFALRKRSIELKLKGK
jgi:hypothetical protein